MDSDKMYAVDRIENDIAICEHLETKQKIELPRTILPSGITEGSIIKYQKGNYIQQPHIEKSRRDRLRAKLNRLKEQSKGTDSHE